VDATNSRVGIGTTTPATLFTVGTTTNILNITDAGKVGVGTTTPGTALYVIGTITATTGFSGDGSALTGVASTPGASSVSSAQIQDGSVSTADLSGTISVSTTGTISAGSTTVTTLTSTGSSTVTGTLTAASSTFRADATQTYVSTRVGIGTTTPSSSYLLQVTSDGDTGVTIGSGGSMTAKTLAVTGTATVTGTLTAGNALRVNTSTLVVDATNSRVGIGTTTPATLFTVGTTTNILNITDAGKVGVGTTTPATALYVIGTITATGEIISRNNGLVVKLEPPPMGEIYFAATNGTATTISSALVFVKAAGVTTFEPNSMYFGTSNTNNRLVYTGTSTKTFHVAMTASYRATNGNVVWLGIAKNAASLGTASTEFTKSLVKDTISSSGELESTAIHVVAKLNQNDYLEVWIANSAVTNVTVETLNMFAMGMSQGTD